MKLMKTLYMLVLFVFLVGCTPPLASSTLTVEARTTPLMTRTHAPMLARTPTFTPVPFEIRPFCPQIGSDMEAIPSLGGTIVLSGMDFSFKGRDYRSSPTQPSILLLWDPIGDEVQTHPLSKGYEFFYYVASPDKRYLAFTEGKTAPMTAAVSVLSAGGLEETKLSLPDEWTLFDWMNNEQLLVRQSRLVKGNRELIAVNPFTGEQQALPYNFPDIYTRETLGSWGALTLFNHDATAVVYPVRPDGSGIRAVLWDVQAGREIARVGGSSGPDYPRWSPDASRLLMVVNAGIDRSRDEIVVVSEQGEKIYSTSFKGNSEKHIIDLPVWSPDGRFVAFWVSGDNQARDARLAVLDLTTSKVDLYCMEVNAFPDRFSWGPTTNLGFSYSQVNGAPPIWSPDGKFILIEDQQYPLDVDDTYLVDLQNHTITLLAKNTRPVGWIR